MDFNKLLKVATYAGQILLENGAETYRVEETIWRICKLYGAEYADSFVTPTGIISSMDIDDKTISLVRRVSNRTVDLDKVDKVNDLSRNILAKNLTIEELDSELRKIAQGERYSFLTTLLFSALGASCFVLLFGGTIKDSIAAFFIGCFIKYLTIKGSQLGINSFFINSIAAGTTTLLTIVLIKLGFPINLDSTIIGDLMLLVPGLAITNAIRDTIAGDLIAGMTRGTEAFLTAISIAVGTGSVLSFFISVMGGI